MSRVASCQAGQAAQIPTPNLSQQERPSCLFRLANRVYECVRFLLRRLFCGYFYNPPERTTTAPHPQPELVGNSGKNVGTVASPRKQEGRRFSPTTPIPMADAYESNTVKPKVIENLSSTSPYPPIDPEEQKPLNPHRELLGVPPNQSGSKEKEGRLSAYSAEPASKSDESPEKKFGEKPSGYTPLHVFCKEAVCSGKRNRVINIEYTNSGAYFFPAGDWKKKKMVEEFDQILGKGPVSMPSDDENLGGLSPLHIALGAFPKGLIAAGESEWIYKQAYWGSMYQTGLGEVVDLLTHKLLESGKVDPRQRTKEKGETPLHFALLPSTLDILYTHGAGDGINDEDQFKRFTPLSSTLNSAMEFDPGHLFEGNPPLISLQKASWLIDKGADFHQDEKDALMNRLISDIRIGEIPSEKSVQIYKWLIEKGANVEDERVSEILQSSFATTPPPSSLEISLRLFESQVPIDPEDVERFMEGLTLSLESRDLDTEELDFLSVFLEKNVIPSTMGANLLTALINRFSSEEAYQGFINNYIDGERWLGYIEGLYEVIEPHIFAALLMIERGFPLDSSAMEGAFFASVEKLKDCSSLAEKIYNTMNRASKQNLIPC